MKKVLVTGAYGQLGTAIHQVSVVTDGFQFVFTDNDTLDITERTAVMAYLQETKPAYVINCAAYTAVDQAENDPAASFRINAEGPGFLAEACSAYSARLIHISTDYVFDGNTNKPYKEDDAPNPLGQYGRSKLEGELRVSAANPEALIIRTSWLYSPTGRNFVKTMIRLGREKEKIKVVFDQTGTPTSASDLAKAILKILEDVERMRQGWHPGIFHYSNEGVCSWYDFAVEVHNFAGISCAIEPVLTEEFPAPTKRPGYSVLDKSRIKSVYGLKIPHWRTSLKNCIQIIQSENHEQ